MLKLRKKLKLLECEVIVFFWVIVLLLVYYVLMKNNMESLIRIEFYIRW